MNDLRFYVYVYCNPLKKGNYSFQANGIGIDFPCAPFYIGKGCNLRLDSHLYEAKKYLEIIEEESIQEEKPKYNRHKVNTINKIHREGKEVIIYKIMVNLEEETSYLLERFFIKLIGRSDKKTGILTNMTDGGEGAKGLSEEVMQGRIKKYRQTLKDNPDIQIKRTEKRMETERNNPGIPVKRKESRLQTLKNNPDIQKNWGLSGSKTKKDNPEICIRAGEKGSKTKKDNPQIIENQVKNLKITLANNPQIAIDWGIKNSQTRKDNPQIGIDAGRKLSNSLITNKSTNGTKNSRYVSLDITLLLQLYFDYKDIKYIQKEYKNKYNVVIKNSLFQRFLNILNFPPPCIYIRRPLNIQRYNDFVEENKYKIDWYIENYERLEEEYFDRRYNKRHQGRMLLSET